MTTLNPTWSADYNPKLNLLGKPFPEAGVPATAFTSVLAEGEYIENWVAARKAEGCKLHVFPAALNSDRAGFNTIIIDRSHPGVGMALVVECKSPSGDQQRFYTSGISPKACREYAREWETDWSPA